jgi:transposase
MAKKGQKQNRIDEELIIKIVKEKKNGKSYSFLAKKYNVSDGSIATWVRRYNYTGTITRKKVGKRKDVKNQTIEELRIEVDILKKFHAFLKLQCDKK